jgi:WXXGXW repeat (2 copies)
VRTHAVRYLRLGVLLALFLTPVTACASTVGTHVYIRTAPPPAVVEVRGVAPVRGYVWVPGYHRWNGRAYVWVPGQWVAPPRARAVWVPARWVHDRHGWYLVEGHWRR